MTVHPRTPGRARSELIVAWVFALLAVALTIAIFVMSEALEAALPVLVPAMFVSSITSVWLGLSARRHGSEQGAVPASIGIIIGGFFFLMLVLAMIGHLIGFE